MIIIGILSAIAIPVFISQRGKARDAATRTDISTIGKEMATYFVDNVGLPPVAAVTGGSMTLGGVVIGKASDGTAFQAQAGTDESSWCVSLNNPEGVERTYQFSAQGGLAAGAC